jgi:hypothetical protein
LIGLEGLDGEPATGYLVTNFELASVNFVEGQTLSNAAFVALGDVEGSFAFSGLRPGAVAGSRAGADPQARRHGRRSWVRGGDNPTPDSAVSRMVRRVRFRER